MFISDVDKQVFEQSRFRAFIYRNQQTALQHILQQTDRFQANRFTSRVRSGNYQQTLFLFQENIQRDDLLVLSLQREEEQGMCGAYPVDLLFVLQDRLDSVHLLGKQRFGADEVDLGQELVGLQDVGH